MAATISELLVRLGVDSADFRSGLEKARKDADGFGKRMDAIGSKIKGAFIGLAAGLSVGALFKGIIQNTIEAENALAQLNSVIKSTGGAAGVSADDVLKLSSSLEKVTTFSDEAITEVQTLLLTIGGMSKSILPVATEAVLNLSTAMGTDAKSAALALAKAIKDPVEGLSALQKAGVKLDDGQKAVIEQLIETGDAAGAVNIIIEKLNESMGNRARDAADTLGGSLAQLKNAFGNLLEGSGGSVEEAKESIQSFTRLLQDEQTKEAFAKMADGVFKLAGALAFLVSKIPDAIEKFQNLAIAAQVAVAVAFNPRLAGGPGGKKGLAGILDGLPDIPDLPTLPPILGVKPRKVGRGGAAKVSEIDQEIKSLQKQLALYGDLSKADEVRIGIKKGYYGLTTPAQEKALQQYADELTALQAHTKAEDEYRKIVKERQEEENKAIIEKDERLRDALEEIEKLLQTEEQAIYASYRRRLDALKELAAQEPAFQARATELSLALIDKMHEELKVKTDEMTEFAKAAAQEIQGAFADFLFDPFKDGLDGMLQNFGMFLKRAIAEAAAAQILSAVGGALSGSGNSFFSAIGKAFAGARAAGGPVSAGSSYLVGEKGPEMFTPNTSGKIIPNDQMASGVTVQNSFVIQGPVSRQTQEQITNAAYRGTLRAARRGGV